MPPRKSKTPTPTSPLDAVEQLVTERAKFEQWLEDLEAKKDSTPPKVYDRVHHDYLTRLQGVMDQLKAHSDTLQTHAASLNKKLIELSSVEESRREERAEAELRAHAGEMTKADWDAVSKRADKELAKLQEDQEVIETDLNRLQAILEELGAEAPKRVSTQKPVQKVDELAFLKSVVGSSTAPQPVASPPKQTPTSAAAQAAQAPVTTTPPAPPAPTPPAPPPVQEAPPAAKPAPPAPPAAAAPPAEPAPPAASKPTPAAGAPVTGTVDPNAPAVSDQPKTLKCQECGTMNYPSEWYCERCGAELTVV